ncbi:MAG: phosphate ABC transporter, permease protein PstA [Desulfurococcales archaeon ex4484_217_2]|nr:MAG: phosphate ABC transporter, permease protein PstA [Desulfurococcales archaeon ex4484_217_2]
MRRFNFFGNLMLAVCGFSTAVLLVIFGYICYLLTSGVNALRLNFLFSSILDNGIFEPLIGTFYLFSGATAIVAPLGTLTAIYMVEYSPRSKLTRLVDNAINNLACVPSIIFGMFGFTFFCKFMGLGISMLSGWLTMACMMLPIMIRSVEEILRMIPESVREAALALGATKWQMISYVILPSAMPGILTGIILSIARIAGETAAVLFTACFYTMRGLPKTPLDPILTLTYYLYVMILFKPGYLDPGEVFGLALVLFLLTTTLSSIAFAVRAYYRLRWGRCM